MNTSRSLKLYWPLIIALIIGSLALAVYLFYPTPRLLTAQPTDEVELNKLTWLEVRSFLQTGKSSIIIPTAGIEQNGPHIILGKHGFIVREAALAIAKELGNALVAPTIETVPEGNIDPPTGHMQYSGTVSIPEEVFEQILEHTARSFKHHGFKTMFFLGDSSGNQDAQQKIAEKLTAEWKAEDVQVFHIDDYYSRNGQLDWLRKNGYTNRQIGTHGGIRDTSELLFVFPNGVRKHLLTLTQHSITEPTGSNGDPFLASPKIGKIMLHLKIQSAVKQIQKLTNSSSN
tara:strand:+ start:1959 stop:2819 length:861 start_codon:yes stop_codon:yes gene_type:complete